MTVSACRVERIIRRLGHTHSAEFKIIVPAIGGQPWSACTAFLIKDDRKSPVITVNEQMLSADEATALGVAIQMAVTWLAETVA